ncbi:MAG: hypothetical protein GPJ54_12725 [Candidatus Heimdallarchaeota archaeon]|nr:hypothetical protein [Candidatus Heimdallarchaeota archaeon]
MKRVLLLLLIMLPFQGTMNEIIIQPISVDNFEILTGGHYEDQTFDVNGYMLINSTDPVTFKNVTLIVSSYLEIIGEGHQFINCSLIVGEDFYLDYEGGYIHLKGNGIDFKDTSITVMISIVITGNEISFNNTNIFHLAERIPHGSVPIGFQIPDDAPIFKISQASNIEIIKSMLKSNISYFSIEDSNNMQIRDNEFSSYDEDYFMKVNYVENISFTGNKLKTAYFHLSFDNSRSINFSNNSGMCSISFYDSNQLKMETNSIKGQLNINRMDGGLINENEFINILFEQPGYAIIKLENVNNTIFQDTIVNGTQTYAFEIGLSNNLTLRRNHFISEHKALLVNNPKGIILENNIFDGIVDYFTFPTLPDDDTVFEVGEILENIYDYPFSYSWDGGERVVNATEIKIPLMTNRYSLLVEIEDDAGNIIREIRSYIIVDMMTNASEIETEDEIYSEIDTVRAQFFIPNIALVVYVLRKQKRSKK